VVERFEPDGGKPANETYERFLSVTGLEAARPAQVAA
jgi:hypothetical protein